MTSMFETAFLAFANAQREQLLKAYSTEEIHAAFEGLQARGLGPQAIETELLAELKLILRQTYDDPIASPRLNGHGWTPNHIKDHMRRKLKLKLDEVRVALVEELSGHHEVGSEVMGPEQDCVGHGVAGHGVAGHGAYAGLASSLSCLHTE